MTLPAPHTHRAARAARAAAFRHDLILGAGAGLSIGLSVAGLTILAGRALGTQLPLWPGVLALGASGGVLAASLWSWSRVWSTARAARELDLRLGLRDLLASALEAASLPGEAPALLVAHAERTAPTLRITDAVPVAAAWRSRGWWWLPVALGISIGVGVWMPILQRRAATPAAPRAAASTLATAITVTEQVRDAAGTDPDLAADHQAAQAFESELAQGRLTDIEARARAAELAQSAAERLDDRAQHRSEQAQALRERLASAASTRPGTGPATDPDGAPGPDSGSDQLPGLAEALRQGDIQRAAGEIDAARRRLETLSPEQREALAQELRRYADSLRTPETTPPTPPDPQASGEPGPAPDQPAHEPADQPPDPSRPSGSQPAPPTPTATDQPPASTPDPAQHPTPDQRPSEDAERLAKAFDDAARELSPQPPKDQSPSATPQPHDATPSPDRPTGERPPTAEKPPAPSKSAEPSTPSEPTTDQKPTVDPSGTQPQGQPQGQPPNPQPGTQPTQTHRDPDTQPDAPSPSPTAPPQGQPKGQPQSSTQTKPQTKPQSQPQSQSQSQNQRTDQSQPGDQSQRQPQGTPQSQTAPQPGDQTPRDTPKTGQPRFQPEMEPRPSPQGRQTSTTPDGSPSAPTSEPSPDALQRLERALREQSAAPADAQRDATAARSLRQKAQDLLAGRPAPQPPPQTPRPGEHAGDQPGPDGPSADPRAGTGPRTTLRDEPDTRPMPTPGTTLDLRGAPSPDDTERPLGEWFGPKDAPVAPGSAVGDRLRRAAAGAEHAIEEQRVPAEYSDLVRRVFRRYVDRAGTGASPPPPRQP